MVLVLVVDSCGGLKSRKKGPAGVVELRRRSLGAEAEDKADRRKLE